MSISVPPPPPLALKKSNSQLDSPGALSKRGIEFETLNEEEDKEIMKELRAKIESLTTILFKANADNSKLNEMKNSLEKKLSEQKAAYQARLEKFLRLLSSSKLNSKEAEGLNSELKSGESKEVFGDVAAVLMQAMISQQLKREPEKSTLSQGKANDDVKKNYEESLKSNQSLQESLAKSNMEKDILLKKIAEIEQGGLQLQNQTRDEIGNLKLTISELKNGVKSLEAKNAALSSTLDNANSHLKEVTTSVDKENAEQKSFLQELLAKKEAELEVLAKNFERAQQVLQKETMENLELSKQNAEILFSKSEIEMQNIELAKKLHEVQNKLSDTQNILEKRESEKEDLQFDNDRIFNDLDEEKAEVAKLQSALKYIEAFKNDFEESSKSWKLKHDALENEVKNYYQNTKISIDDQNLDKNRLESEIKDLKEKCEAMISTAAKLESVQVEHEQLNRSFSALQQELERTKLDHEVVVQDMNAVLEENEKELIAYEEELSELKEQYLQTKLAHQEQFAMNKSLLASNDRLFHDAPEDESDLKQLDVKIKELDQKIIDLSKELEIAKFEQEEQKKANHNLEDLIKTLSRNCVESEKAKNSLEGSILVLEDENQVWKRKCEDLQNSSRQSDFHISELKAKIEQLVADISSNAEEKKSLIGAKQNFENSQTFWKRKHDTVLNTLEEQQTNKAMQQ